MKISRKTSFLNKISWHYSYYYVNMMLTYFTFVLKIQCLEAVGVDMHASLFLFLFAHTRFICKMTKCY